ncbi:hypothetical protein DTL21_21550 [Bremerella cremea]|uniref:Thioredoxin domain-containing protein n=1 Tax=Blastopirellula marina TaxID=124 RepID=A0A2S8FLJ4_9BACT|nr:MULTISPECIES: hypothetical protein [Pirellulaceae]PQO32774.1 hypothetical protein C5Y83_21530 [Blastopirellula marina]RCS45841.1 hypothetical protein DTL21_21550 [Bremerella cremea]
MRPQQLPFLFSLCAAISLGCTNASTPDLGKADNNSDLPNPTLSHVVTRHLGEQPGAFEVEDVTGPAAGESLCYRCRYSGRPTVVIFTREVNDSVSSLVQQIDHQVEKNIDKKLSAFMVVLEKDTAKVEPELKRIQASQEIRNTPLTVYHDPEGPAGYSLSPDAKIQVMMWNKEGIKVNEPIRGDLSPEEISQLVAQTNTILN